MGAASALSVSAENNKQSEMARKTKGESNSVTSHVKKARKTKGESNSVTSHVKKADSNFGATAKRNQKRRMSENAEKPPVSGKMPKRAAACSDFTTKSFRLTKKSSLVAMKRKAVVEDEMKAIELTSGHDHPRPNRRLTDYTFHDADGKPQSFEMLEVDNLFISGLILPLEESFDKDKDTGVPCEGFGRIETWAISGYEEGSPVIWISTEIADYECLKPANKYKKQYSLFFEKARACVEVYKKLSRACGGNPDLTLDELLAAVVRSMNDSKNFPHGKSIKDFLISNGEFIYNELIGLDETSKENDQIFRDLPVLAALKDESRKHGSFVAPKGTSSHSVPNTSLKIGDGDPINQISSSAFGTEEDEDMKLARLLKEEENWRSMKHNKRQRQVVLSSKFYIKSNEDEIANDYPLPEYYKTTDQEVDEYIFFGNDFDISNPDELPHRMLHNWSLYNSDSRLVSLELLPMKCCADIDVTIYGSGNVTDDKEHWISLDEDENQSSSSDAAVQTDGIPIYLSAIKEWKIEFRISEISILIRTDMAWYRLGKPSKQYAPWFGPVLKTVKLADGIITLLTYQTRVSRLSFADVIKRVSEFGKNNRSYISSNPAAVGRYVVVHGQIILQQFAEHPDDTIRKCAFVTGLWDKMEERHHTKWLVKKKVVLEQGVNLNPRAAVAPVVSKWKVMPATTTRLINRIWGEYYTNYLPEDSKEAESHEVKEDEEAEDEGAEDEEDSKEAESHEVKEDEEADDEWAEDEDEDEDYEEAEEDKMQVDEKTEKSHSAVKLTKSSSSHKYIKWDGETMGKTCAGRALYKQAIVGNLVAVGGCVLVETDGSDELPSIYFVEYMFENSDARKIIHGRQLVRGSSTVLGNAANEREVFLTNDCLEFELGDVKETVVVELRLLPWGYQHRKANAQKDKIDRERADERKNKGLSMEYYCKSLYWPQRGAFFSLPTDTMGLGSGVCHSCNVKESQRVKETFKMDFPGSGFTLRGIEYHVNDFLYLAPHDFSADGRDHETFKSGRNVGLKAYVVCQLLEIEVPEASKQACPESTKVKVRRFFRPEDISTEKAYCSDIREVYYSEQILMVTVMAVEGMCEVRKKHELPSLNSPEIFEHIFFCEHLYDPDKGTINQLPAHVKLSSSKERVADDAAYRKENQGKKNKNKGKSKEVENNSAENDKQTDVVHKNRLATLDIFAGCGGLTEGLQQAGVSLTKWAIEYDKPAGEAFSLNHPEALMFNNNCNVILRAIMTACGDEDDCLSTSEATELAKKLDEKEIKNLPRPGQVEFINGGPPCQGFSGLNRFNQGTWSKVQCEMILAFLSFADYFRPRFFLLENVRNFVSFNKGLTFRLTLASLLEMGYQVRFGILEAGAYGIAQSRKRAFIWAASPEEILPEWPEPMHVFAGPELKVTLSGNSQYAAVGSTANGAPFRSITVKDTIGDLPAVGNGASATIVEYKNEPVSWFQKKIRENMLVLTDHISKEMNVLNLIRCQRIPKRPGADWRDLPDEKVWLSEGQAVDLIPCFLPNTAKRHNQWKGLLGRLDWDGNFRTSVTDPQPMGKVGMCFHPVQDRIITVRECARSQGFRDSYKFAGNIQHKHRQIGNAVPPPLAFALGRKLKEVI